VTAIQECGWAGWAALGGGLLGLFVAFVALALAFAKPRVGGAFSLLALAIALGPAGCGAIGSVQGKSKVDAVVDSVGIDPAQRERIRQQGYAEAGACLPVGLGASALPFVLSAVALGIALVRRQPVDH
jgi:hypothetical protein